MSLPFEYNFPAIRGIQAGREYYVSMCPVRLISKLFSFDDEEVPTEMRAQRTLNVARIPDIAHYILDNTKNYIFSAITVSIDADIEFEPLGAEDIGSLKVPMEARFIINDGQHRRAAFEMALKENIELRDETIAVVFFLDAGLKRSQQMFTDLNRYAARPDSSLNILYDHRDKKSILIKEVIRQIPLFKNLTETERSSLTQRSTKLFTLSSLYGATNALISHHRDVELDEQIKIAVQYWQAVCQNMPDWEQVLTRKVSAGEIRRDYIHSYAVTLAGLGRMGATLISIYSDNWVSYLEGLQKIDWLKTNPDWEGRIMNGGRIGKSRANVDSITAYVKKALDLPLSAEEERLESFRQ
jgi:DNA sulfur modification protein DndB